MRRTWALRVGERELVLTPGSFTIGRSSSCDLILDDPRVSRVHAVIRVGIDSATIEDTGSHNGVLVGGARIDKARELADKDIIAIGGEQIGVSVREVLTRKHSRDRTMPQAEQHRVRVATGEGAPLGAAAPAASTAAVLEQLSAREREVLALVARGHTSREVAERLGLSSKTVEGYRARLSDKLELRTRAALVDFALSHGLLAAPDPTETP